MLTNENVKQKKQMRMIASLLLSDKNYESEDGNDGGADNVG